MIFAIIFFMLCAAALGYAAYLGSALSPLKIFYHSGKDIKHNEIVPEWLGLVRYDWASGNSVYAWMPIALTLRFSHNVWTWARFGPYPGAELRELQSANKTLQDYIEDKLGVKVSIEPDKRVKPR